MKYTKWNIFTSREPTSVYNKMHRIHYQCLGFINWFTAAAAAYWANKPKKRFHCMASNHMHWCIMTVGVTIWQIRIKCLAEVTAWWIQMNCSILVTRLNVLAELGRTATHSSWIVSAAVTILWQHHHWIRTLNSAAYIITSKSHLCVILLHCQKLNQELSVSVFNAQCNASATYAVTVSVCLSVHLPVCMFITS